MANAFQLGSRDSKNWIPRLERPGRVSGLKIGAIIARLGLKPGDLVADLGAGAGVFSIPLAKAIAPDGKLFAVDIQEGFISHIRQQAEKQRVLNVQAVLGEHTDPKLPAQVDLAFIHDVLHHVERREIYLKALDSYIKPGGRIALIELNNPHEDDQKMNISRAQVNAWFAAAGFHPAEEFDLLEDKYFVIFDRH